MCMLCRSKEPERCIDLYVFGSEGLRVCHDCEMKLVEFARQLGQRALSQRWQERQLTTDNEHFPTVPQFHRVCPRPRQPTPQQADR